MADARVFFGGKDSSAIYYSITRGDGLKSEHP